MKALVKACENEDFPAEIVMVLANKADALGLEFAHQNNIKTAIINHRDFSSRQEFDAAMTAELEKCEAEIICLAGFMRLLSSQFVDHWLGRLINIHPSLLPEFKGANAVGDAIKAGATKSGCTVHYVSAEMDEGPAIIQAEVEVSTNDNEETLAAKILKEEHKIYPLALKAVCEKFTKN